MSGQRIVSLIPSAIEIVAALGCSGRLVGRSHECDFPPGLEDLPICTRPRLDLAGTSADIDAKVRDALKDALAVYEVLDGPLRAAGPDVIITQNRCEVCAVSLADVEAAVCEWVGMDVTIVSLEPNRLSDVYADIGRVALALGVEADCSRLVAALQARAQAISDTAANLPDRPRVATIEWTEPLMAAGNWVPEQISLAGGTDPFDLAGKHSPVLDWNDLVAAAPDVVIFMPCGYDLIRTRADAEAFVSRPGFADLPAARGGRVFITNGSDFFNRPGPRLAESLEIMAELLHPDAFDFGHAGQAWEPLAVVDHSARQGTAGSA